MPGSRTGRRRAGAGLRGRCQPDAVAARADGIDPGVLHGDAAYVERHGKPQTVYSVKAGVFRINARDSVEGRGYTQFGRALFELNIDILRANTSQAKGRVEPMNDTVQDRLVKELRLREISSVDPANAFAPALIADFNTRFGKVAHR